MMRTLEVEVDHDGVVHPIEPHIVVPPGRAILICQTDPVIDMTLLSEAALAVDWLRPEEDEAWAS